MKRSKEGKDDSTGRKREKALKAISILFVLAIITVFAYLFIIPPTLRGGGSVKVYFYVGEELRPAARTLPEGKTRPAFAVDQLLRGPSKEERGKGFFTQIPDGTKMRGLFVEEGVAFLDLNKRVGEYGGGTSNIEAIIAQFVYTLTDIPGIREVGFLIEGKPKVALGGEGYIIEKPLGRRDVFF